MNIGLWYSQPDKMCGCWKVIDNTVRGLSALGYTVKENQMGDFNGVLQIEPLKQQEFPKETLIGPEIMVLPTEYPELWKRFRTWVQPSQWVINYMVTFPETRDNQLWPWAVGIDTERFQVERGPFQYDCFIYYKNVTRQTPPEKLEAVEKHLDSIGVSHVRYEYGNYTEYEKMDAAKRCKFGIYLAGTESQGIALMEFLSMDVPMYVLDETVFMYGAFKYTDHAVSSAPYFSTECGIKIRGFNLEYIPQMLKRKFEPRKWILRNHTLKHGAEQYVNRLRKAHDRSNLD